MKKQSIILAIAVLMGVSFRAEAVPKNVIIIRHGNKTPGEMHLNLEGYERAAALPYYFAKTPLYNNPPIAHVFAAGLSDLDKPDESIRPIETCTPTADYLKLPLNIDFKHTQNKELAQEILTNPKYNNSTVLICWEHWNIRPLEIALGAEDLGHWKGDVFDQVYLLTYTPGNPKPTIQVILQKLMFGDRATFSSPEPPLPSPHIEK